MAGNYPVSEPTIYCDLPVDTTFGLYLGSLIADPVTTIEGTYYWNSVANVFKVWSHNTWIQVNPSAFDGIVDGGTINRLDSIQVRGDTSTNWSITNPILLIREIGLETNTSYIKFGDGTSHWNDLPYQTIPSSRVTGFENVDNTSDIDKPVSTLQATANALVLTQSKTYTDSKLNNVLIDQGLYLSQTTGLFPTGTIKQGYIWTINDTGLLGTKLVKPNVTIRALVNNPGQTESNWLFDGLDSTNPYIIGSYIQGLVYSTNIYLYHIFAVPVIYSTNFALSKAIAKQASVTTVIFDIVVNGLTVGTLTFTAGVNTGVFNLTSPITCSIDSVIELISTTSDPVLSDITISLYGTH